MCIYFWVVIYSVSYLSVGANVILSFFFWRHNEACGILVPQPEIEPMPPAVEAWNLPWTTFTKVLNAIPS